MSVNRAGEFREQLARRVMVADGAMGTMLYSRGVFINRCFDELNLSSPDMVAADPPGVRQGRRRDPRDQHVRRQPRSGWPPSASPKSCSAINQAGVRLAREAAGDGAFVAGAVGPLGVRIEPLGPTSFAEARAVFREQIEALLEAGVDLLILETFGNLDELREAVFAGARSRRRRHADRSRRSPSTISATCPAAPTPRPSPRELDYLAGGRRSACNCSVGPKAMLETIEQMMQLHHQAAQRHAQRRAADARWKAATSTSARPSTWRSTRAGCCGRASRSIGGCCGTTPEHIKLIRSRSALAAAGAEADWRSRWKSRRPRRRRWPQVPVAEKSQAGRQTGRRASSSPSWRSCRRAAWTPSREIAGAKLCAEHGIDCINVPDGPRASARMSAQVTCQLIQQQAGIEAVHPLLLPRPQHPRHPVANCWARTRLGVRNLICITGDPPRMGAYPDATAVFDVDAIGLVNIVNNLNHGLDIGGNPMGSQTALLIGVGANPGALNMDEEIRRFEWKVEAGAEYVVTQPVFDLDLLEAFPEAHRARSRFR